MHEGTAVVAPVVLPLALGLLSWLGGSRGARLLILPGLAASLAACIWLLAEIVAGATPRHALGGWGAPLGIELVGDSLSAVMVAMTAAVYAGVVFYARAYFRDAEHANEARTFWPLAWLLWASLNALFVSADLFNLYVALELVALAAVALAALTGTPPALSASLRYLLVALLGSSAYLLAVALLYAATGTLALASVGAGLSSGPLAATAAALAVIGLALKGALFPFHFWLPPAHGSAATPVSALLSALVIKAAFYLVLRLWLEVFGGVAGAPAGQLLGALGAAAIVWGSLAALAQDKLKMLVAYSTVAQVGYLFLLFPLLGAASQPGAREALEGGVLQALAHALAKAAMFLAAGTLVLAARRDDLAALEGAAARAPLSVFAFALAGLSLIGLPPSGGFVAKWLLLRAALASGQWWWAPVLIVGGLLSAAYVFRAMRRVFLPTPASVPQDPPARTTELTAFALASAALLLGLGSAQGLEALDAGQLLSRMQP